MNANQFVVSVRIGQCWTGTLARTMTHHASGKCWIQSESRLVWHAGYTAHSQWSSVMCVRINAFIFSLLAMMAFHSAAALAQGSDPLFDAPWRAFGTGDFPTIRAAFFDVGDIDGDGDLDVVASLQMFSGPGISILRSNGDGTFAAEVVYQLNFGDEMGEVVLADFDLDGDLDALATVPGNAGTGSGIAVWRNNGDGTYTPPIHFATGDGPIGLVVGDFTGDGFPDVVTADFGYIAGLNDTISLLRHNGMTGGQAGFLNPTLTHVGDNSRRLAAADIDADGDLDLVVGRALVAGDSGINVLTNDGSGNFAVGTSFQSVPGVSRSSAAVVLADVDNDGDFDLISGAGDFSGSLSIGKIAIRLNDGAGSFGAPAVYDLVLRTFTPHSINVGDLNGDGRLDVIASTPSGRQFDGWNVLMSSTSGGYQPAQFFTAAKQTFDLAALDADGDGDLDIVTVANDSSVATVHENQGGGEFFVPARWPLDALHRDMDFGDIDNDGDLDLVTAAAAGIYYMRNNADGTFAPVIRYVPPLGVGEVKLRDMNNDGFLDLLMSSHPNNPPYHFAVSLNNGDGTFAPGVITFVGACQGGQIDAFDLDNDGDLDVVLTEPGGCPGGGQVHIFIARNNGNGTSFTLMTPLSGFGLPWRIGGADLDHDGNIDLVSATSLGVTVFPGNGDLTFAAHMVVGAGGVFDFVLADLNLDGNEDICLLIPPDGSFGTGSVGTQLGRGDLTFEPRTTFPGPTGLETGFRISKEIEATDVNGDGNPDIILSNNAPNDVSIFLGNGDGTLQPHDRYGMGHRSSDALAADFTGDGIVDIVAVVALPPFALDDAVVLIAGRKEAGGCYADCDVNGVLDIFDFLCFQNSFVNAEPYACACDPDPACDIFDFLCFQNAFVAGCP